MKLFTKEQLINQLYDLCTEKYFFGEFDEFAIISMVIEEMEKDLDDKNIYSLGDD